MPNPDGRPPGPPELRKHNRSIKVDDGTWLRWRLAASSRECTISEWIRVCVDDASEKVLSGPSPKEAK
jgi:macrodomain Ter protein organizer (MatP/YcbG family)